MLIRNKEKLCRRLGQKLLLSHRCEAKCALDRKRTKPGVHGHKEKAISDYGKLLLEKQKLRFFYLLKDKQLKNIISKCQKFKEPLPVALIKLLESKLDNIIWRAGLAQSKFQAKQLVAHGHFMVNGRRVKSSYYFLEPGEVVEVREKSRKIALFKDLEKRINKYNLPPWLNLDLNNLKIEFLRYPDPTEVVLPFNIDLAVQFFSRY